MQTVLLEMIVIAKDQNSTVMIEAAIDLLEEKAEKGIDLAQIENRDQDVMI